MTKYFVIADTHFSHDNIIKYCNRPFKDINHMNSALIKKWNTAVSKRDYVFVLGDFSLGNAELTKVIVSQLNGYKILVKGNHDKLPNDLYLEAGFKEVSSYPILFEGFYLMSHEPLILSQTTPYFNFYGHTHNDDRYADTPTSKCVSVERIGYQPYKFLVR